MLIYPPAIPKSAITRIATASTTGASLGPRTGSCLPPTFQRHLLICWKMKGELLTREATGWFEMDLDAIGEPVERPPNEPSATASDDPSRDRSVRTWLPCIRATASHSRRSRTVGELYCSSSWNSHKCPCQGWLYPIEPPPTPMGSPSINSSTTDPMVSLSFLTNSISCDIDLVIFRHPYSLVCPNQRKVREEFFSLSQKGSGFYLSNTVKMGTA